MTAAPFIAGAAVPPRPATYGPCPIRARRTKADMAALRGVLYSILRDEHPMTVRQVFYQLVSRGAIAKTEGEYKRTVVRLLLDMRLNGDVPFGWIADNTRWQRKPRTYSGWEEALRSTAATYRRALWFDQSVYVEVWLEKDALAGVLYEETQKWDVPLMVVKGFPSVSFLYETAEAMKAQGRPAYLYYFGDHDPSGLAITRNIEARLREFAPDVPLHVERLAVTPAQIAALSLPTRPTKETDSRSKGFVGESVEVDAIPSATLRELAEECITQHLDWDALDVLKVAERSERDYLTTLAYLPREEGEVGA
jgi:hypothetical protein